MEETADTAPKPVDELTSLVSNVCLDGNRLWLMTLQAPEIVGLLLPGQFVHLRVPGMEGHILRRPFSVYDIDTEEGTLDILYQVIGAGSAHMAILGEGTAIDVMGPVGTGWTMPARPQAGRALLVGGGVGAAPLYLFARQLVQAGWNVDVVLGAQMGKGLVTAKRYEGLLGTAPTCATDDGSFGFAGFCTLPADEMLQAGGYDACAVCGPTPVMKAVAASARAAGVPCQVSMERRMACGIGACLSCVVETVDGRRRSCVDGPVFAAEKVVW